MRRIHTKANALERFMRKITRRENGCWDFATNSANSYGVFVIEKGRPTAAHRASWLLHRGRIPRNLFVLHRCDRRQCVNPDHLFVGTHRDNMRDMHQKGRGGPKSKAGRDARGLFPAGGSGFVGIIPRLRPVLRVDGVRVAQDTWQDIEAFCASHGDWSPHAVLGWLAEAGLRFYVAAEREGMRFGITKGDALVRFSDDIISGSGRAAARRIVAKGSREKPK